MDPTKHTLVMGEMSVGPMKHTLLMGEMSINMLFHCSDVCVSWGPLNFTQLSLNFAQLHSTSLNFSQLPSAALSTRGRPTSNWDVDHCQGGRGERAEHPAGVGRGEAGQAHVGDRQAAVLSIGVF